MMLDHCRELSPAGGQALAREHTIRRAVAEELRRLHRLCHLSEIRHLLLMELRRPWGMPAGRTRN